MNVNLLANTRCSASAGHYAFRIGHGMALSIENGENR